MASKDKRKKGARGDGASSFSGANPHASSGGCNCEGCLRMLAASGRTDDRDPFNLRFSQMRQRLEKCVRAVPTRLLKAGMKGPSLAKCLQDLTFIRMEEEYDQQLKEAHALAKFDPARPILAAGLYSEAEECQVAALMCFYSYVKDGDFERGFPSWCNALKRHMELLDSEDYEVVSYAAMSIALLGNSPYFCDVNPTGGLQHRFYEIGAVHKMMALMSKQPTRRKQRGTDTLEVVKMECCYALAGLLANYVALRQPWVPERVISEPAFLDSVIKLTYCPQKGGEVQRMALMCLGSIAQMTDDVKAEVVRLGGREAAEKALKMPFADSSVGRDQETKRRAVIVIKALMSVAPSAPPKKPVPSADQIAAMSVRELEELLTQHNVSTQGCVEKADLQNKAHALLGGSASDSAAPAAASAEETKSGIPGAERRENGSPGTGVEDKDEVEKKESRAWGVVDRKVDGLPSTVEVLAMPTKDILAWLRRLEVSTEGCLERQDLALKLMGQLQLMHTAAAMAEEDDAAPPTLDLALPSDETSAGDATSAALMDLFNTATNKAARLAAEEALAQLSMSEDLPADISLERAILLVVKGKSAATKRMGLTVVVAAIDKSGHELRHRLDAAGVLKATVRLLHERDRPSRWHVVEALCTFAKSPSLAPKIWGYGAMGPILEEVKSPDVLRAIKKQKRGVVDGDPYSLIMLCSLRLLANMLIPASMEDFCRPEGGTVLTSSNQSTVNTDPFTRKLGRWLVKSGVHSQIASMLGIARSTGWTRATQDREITISVVQQGGRVLQLLVQNTDVAEAIIGLPDILPTMAHFVQQYRVSPEEAAAAAIFLTHVLQFHEDKIDKLWGAESIARTAEALKTALVSNVLSPPDFTSHSVLLALLASRLAAGAGVNGPPAGASVNTPPSPWQTAVAATLSPRFTAGVKTEPGTEREAEEGSQTGAVALTAAGTAKCRTGSNTRRPVKREMPSTLRFVAGRGDHRKNHGRQNEHGPERIRKGCPLPAFYSKPLMKRDSKSPRVETFPEIGLLLRNLEGRAQNCLHNSDFSLCSGQLCYCLVLETESKEH
ncbi:hypothetical protein KFL_000400160 [Klebsormidium nitens]|uniref:Uncharacterized protein n=1 Tax=Klebsormidium nitens TaxID=105231 RepID=A0A1Y1HPA1_KLENI|nr:hypothetical protein KFL_000400160 [Klebsormidium nitens]|eukprot:GAQ79873.1 hypothetical protein KFL_000400160 [Klebsormidium nitens]